MKDHIPFQYDTCPCSECRSSRENRRLREENERLINEQMRRKLGPNWKNVMSGMGDQ